MIHHRINRLSLTEKKVFYCLLKVARVVLLSHSYQIGNYCLNYSQPRHSHLVPWFKCALERHLNGASLATEQ